MWGRCLASCYRWLAHRRQESVNRSWEMGRRHCWHHPSASRRHLPENHGDRRAAECRVAGRAVAVVAPNDDAASRSGPGC